MTPERVRPHPVRVHQVRLRPARIRIVDILLLFGVILVTTPGTYFAVEWSLMPLFKGRPEFHIIVFLLLAMIYPPATSAYFTFRWVLKRRRRKARMVDAWRYDRLSRVVQHPQAMERLPHRVVEHACVGSISLDRIRRRGVPDLPPGHVIILLSRRTERTPIHAPIDFAFEPIQLGRDVERQNWLASVNCTDIQSLIDSGELDAKSPMFHLDVAYKKKVAHPNAKSRRSDWIAQYRRLISMRAVRVSLYVYGAALALVPIVTALLTSPAKLLEYVVIGTIAGAIGLSMCLFRHQTTFLFPGGIAERTTFLAGRKAVIRRFTNADASIIITMPFSAFMLLPLVQIVRSREKPNIMLAPAEVILAAWMSTAPTPTFEQLEPLLDPKA